MSVRLLPLARLKELAESWRETASSDPRRRDDTLAALDELVSLRTTLELERLRALDVEVERLRAENAVLRSLDTYGGLLSLASDLRRLADYAATLRDHQEPGHARLIPTQAQFSGSGGER